MAGPASPAFNADRLLNRLWDYPRRLRRRAVEFDLFHVCDHSYAQLVHALPAGRVGVYCHDLDAFRSLLEPREARPRWFRAVAGHILRGLQKAALVFYSTGPVRDQIVAHGLIDPDRLVHAPPGVSPEFTACPEGPDKAVPFPRRGAGRSCFTSAAASAASGSTCCCPCSAGATAMRRTSFSSRSEVNGPRLRRRRSRRLGIGQALVQGAGLSRDSLAALYRAAAVVVVPSEAEGFGLPLPEALACGAVVAASDLPVLREVGGAAAVYCPMGEVADWAAVVSRLIARPDSAPPRAARLARQGSIRGRRTPMRSCQRTGGSGTARR